NMSRQNSRRILVILIYLALILMLLLAWFADHFRHSGPYLIIGTTVLNSLLLGGYPNGLWRDGRFHFGGLIKPFKVNREAIQRMENAPPPPLILLKLHMYNPTLDADKPEFENDERELQQRDHAHFKAYQGLTICLLVLWMLSD